MAQEHHELSVDEAHAYMAETHGRDCSPSTLRRYVRAGILTARINERGEFRFRCDALDELHGRTADYAAAERRVRSTPRLDAYRDTILAGPDEGGTFWQWVASAPVAQIVDWAKARGTSRRG